MPFFHFKLPLTAYLTPKKPHPAACQAAGNNLGREKKPKHSERVESVRAAWDYGLLLNFYHLLPGKRLAAACSTRTKRMGDGQVTAEPDRPGQAWTDRPWTDGQAPNRPAPDRQTGQAPGRAHRLLLRGRDHPARYVPRGGFSLFQPQGPPPLRPPGLGPGPRRGEASPARRRRRSSRSPSNGGRENGRVSSAPRPSPPARPRRAGSRRAPPVGARGAAR